MDINSEYIWQKMISELGTMQDDLIDDAGIIEVRLTDLHEKITQPKFNKATSELKEASKNIQYRSGVDRNFNIEALQAEFTEQKKKQATISTLLNEIQNEYNLARE